MREFDGLTYDQISARLRLSRAAVDTLLFRARRGFRDAYCQLATKRVHACFRLTGLVHDALEDDRNPRRRSELNQHLDACSRCRGIDGTLRSKLALQ
jgi:hypothetical protein